MLIYACLDNYLYAVNKYNGRRIWRTSLPRRVTHALQVAPHGWMPIIPESANSLRIVSRFSGANLFEWVATLAERWGRRLTVSVLLVIGIVLAADAIGWFLGYPLLPVDNPPD